MHGFKRLTAAVAIAAAPAAVIAFSAAGAGAEPATPSPKPNPQGATKVELGTTNRGCNFNTESQGNGTGKGSGFAIINTTGSGGPNGSNKVIAEVHLTNAAPNTTYQVRLIELPSSTCGDGAAGVVAGTIQTNAAGNGNVNLQENVVPNATGAWVTVVGPNLPTGPDLYTSNNVVPV